MPKSKMTKSELKELTRKVIVAQGNVFIKELLRNNGAQIGATKEDFTTNLNAAIDTGIITQDKLESWLEEVEGWGDQHLYLVAPPGIKPSTLAKGIADNKYVSALGTAASLDFPDTLQLKHVVQSKDGVSMVWHQRKEGWNRWKPKDFHDDEGLELYRFEAYRQRFDRSVIRYEWQFSAPYAAILIHRNTEIDHNAVFDEVRETLVTVGCPNDAFVRIPLSQAVKTAAKNDRGVHSTRFELDSGYVEMASTLPEGGIESVEPVRVVLHSVDANKFQRAQGMLHFGVAEHGTSRRVAVQVYGSEGRLRIFAQCKREDIVSILKHLWEYNGDA